MKQIDGDRILREIRKNNNMVVISCKTKYFPLDLIRKIIHEAPEIETCKSKVTSNADRIRSMSDEELVVFLDNLGANCSDCAKLGKNHKCEIYKEGFNCRPKDIMEWLQKEVEEE